ncbi:hypothetical protein VB711_19115 [Cronbergia sp. UHCC 0137]|uniref:hypothetical protein n=1 Tax=Cronbergia sp. UHCC 0137 TaxID=3110239 RepID=UPI002B21F817|nr:hypothetical protein [Cronbergia sp. UHCC 0137]MEA5619939.1 hypothetical protein [Cronbergia sp. UHCC 0137]
MKLLTGFAPKALLTNRCYRPISPKQRLLQVIELLDNHGVLTDYNSRLLEAIATAPLWDEKAHNKFESLGLEIAKEQFYWNCYESEEYLASPDNPDNWSK